MPHLSDKKVRRQELFSLFVIKHVRRGSEHLMTRRWLAIHEAFAKLHGAATTWDLGLRGCEAFGFVTWDCDLIRQSSKTARLGRTTWKGYLEGRGEGMLKVVGRSSSSSYNLAVDARDLQELSRMKPKNHHKCYPDNGGKTLKLEKFTVKKSGLKLPIIRWHFKQCLKRAN